MREHEEFSRRETQVGQGWKVRCSKGRERVFSILFGDLVHCRVEGGKVCE